MDRVKTSIVIWAYNEAQFIKRTLESVIGEADEIIISDNGSTDGTSEICKVYAAQYSEIKYFRHEKNKGASFNYTFAINHATGDYIRLIGAHDIITSGSTKSMLKIMEGDPDCVMVYSKHTIFLNSDYTVNCIGNSNSYYDECVMKLASDCVYARVSATLKFFNQLCGMCWALYKRNIIVDLFEIELSPDFSIDQVYLTYAASIGKIIPDTQSVFYWMYNRPVDVHDYKTSGIRMVKMVTNSRASNPYVFYFLLVAEQYKIALNLQKNTDCPEGFAVKILNEAINNWFQSIEDPFTLDGFPYISPGNEEIVQTTAAAIIEYQKHHKKRLLKRLFHAPRKFLKLSLPYGIVRLIQIILYRR